MALPAGADLAHIGAAIGQPARAGMLGALLGGQWLTATELARTASVAPPTASAHLAALVAVGLVRKRKVGRRRYHALAGPEVAAALEGLLRLAPPDAPDRHPRSAPERALRFARTCYDHLAGALGVWLAETMLTRGLLSSDGTALTPTGKTWLRDLAIDDDTLGRGRRTCVRWCLDWSERRDHLGGAVGAAITEMMLGRCWLARMTGTRAVRLTLRGRVELERVLGTAGLPVPSPGPAEATRASRNRA